jgi:two-component sensor histidine kinase/CheY-like chemotaxis protein
MNSRPKTGDIMIVDDSLDNLRLLSMMLEGRGYQVRSALNGDGALAAVMSDPPDLIFMDIIMPGIDGYEVCRRLKADPRTSHIPILFISALSEMEDKVKGFSVGGVDYITKPFQIEEVVARVETHLNIRRLQDEIKIKEETTRALLNASPDAAFLVMADETVLTSNQPGKGELPASSLSGKKIWDNLPCDVAKARRAQMEKVVLTGMPARFEEDETGMCLDITIYPLFNLQDKVDKVAIYIRDITSRKIAEEQLKRSHDDLELKVRERTSELELSNMKLQEEIAERRHAEDVIIATLREKEMLLREVHHRVKNNLQVISSLLYLQSKKAEDSKTLGMLKDSQNRIKSMALVHEKLSFTRQAKIDFAEYIKNLAANLLQSYGQRQISLRMNLDCASINLDTALPCGLIINELVSNSIKHAFPDGRGGEISIELHSGDSGRYLMVVSDTGVGLKTDIAQSDTLGLQLVNTLVKQIDGQMRVDCSAGTRYEIDFKELSYREIC